MSRTDVKNVRARCSHWC